MIVIMEEGATEAQVEAVIDRLVEMRFTVHRSTGMVHTVLGGVGPEDQVEPTEFEVMPGVKECRRIMAPYKLASRHFRPAGTTIEAGSIRIGGPAAVVIAGPCLVESPEQIHQAAEAVARAGARILYGGARRARPGQAFTGLGEEAFPLLRAAADAHGLAAATSVAGPDEISAAARLADLLVIDGWNMFNSGLLREAAATGKPVLLRRNVGSTLEDLLLAAEQILQSGHYDVALCECGIRTFESPARLTLDLNALPLLRRLTHLPVLVDPSQAAGRRDQVAPLARAAIAAGADGVVVEVHPDPAHARAEGAQTLPPDQFAELMPQLRAIASAAGRSF